MQTFASGLPPNPVDLDVTPDGALYYLVRGVGVAAEGDQSGALYRIEYPERATEPRVLVAPQDQRVPVNAPVAFSVQAVGDPVLAYQWQRNGVSIPGAKGPTLLLPRTSLQDDGASYQVVVANAAGLTLSKPARLTVVDDEPPHALIRLLSPRRRGNATPILAPGQTVRLLGLGLDRRDGRLRNQALTWQVDLRHNTHAHPFVPATTGTRSFEFTIPTDVHDEGLIWYRVYLTATDSAGLSTTTTFEVIPSNSPLAALQPNPRNPRRSS